MWFVISKRRHREICQEYFDQSFDRLKALGETIEDIEQEIERQDVLLKGTERQKVLTDIQLAVNLVAGYQRALSSLAAADPYVLAADAFLERWGAKSETNSYLGFERPNPFEPAPDHQTSMDLDEIIPLDGTVMLESKRRELPSRTQIEEEEIRWGEEAYGSANVRIEAVVIDEGDEKEPGYTWAHLQFVDLDAEEPNGD